MRYFFPAACAALLGGCLYTNVHTPRAWRSATPSEVKSAASDDTVSGRACLRSVLYLVAWGDAGYDAAARKALEGKPDAILYDVKADMKATSVLLGLYAQVCTVVTGKAAKP